MMKRKIFITAALILLPLMVHAAATLPQYDVLPFIDDGIKGPMRIAVGAGGEIYVTDSLRHKVVAYSNNGVKLFNITDMKDPLGIAVDGLGNILVGNKDTMSIRVYDPHGDYLYSLAEGELDVPADIGLDSAGNIYVVESKSASVQIYDASGQHVTSFGSNRLIYPVTIEIDEANSELYVADMSGNKVVRFGMDGTYKNAIAGGGSMFSGAGAISIPQGVLVQGDYIYIADSYYSVIAVFHKTDGFVGYMGENGGGAGELKIPIDIEMDSNNKLYVANFDMGRIEVLGVDAYREWSISPSQFDVTVYEKGNPVTQGVAVSSNVPSEFTVRTDAAWLTALPQTGITDDIVEVTVNPVLMTEGVYNGTVSIISDNETENIVAANVTVVRDYSMMVTPDSLTLAYQKGSDTIPMGTILVDTRGGNFSWKAAASESWIGFHRASGYTGTSSMIKVTPDVTGLGIGTYKGVINIVAGKEVAGSPARVDITLHVVKAGSITVTTNLDEASFSISGPVTYNGSGTSWSAGDVPQGRYTIVFDHIPGYVKPAAEDFYVKSGKEVTIEGLYSTKNAMNAIAAVSAGSAADMVSILDTATLERKTMPVPVGDADLVTGDFNGDGFDEIAVLSGGQSVKIYGADGPEVGGIDFDRTVIDMTVTDRNGDGVDDLIILLQNKRDVSVRAITMMDNSPVEITKLMRVRIAGDATMTLGDFNGDGITDIALADNSTIQVYDQSVRKSRIISSIAHQSVAVPQMAASDLDDDGIYEIIASGQDASGINIIRILSADGTDYTEQIGSTGLTGVAHVSAGDEDGDGLDEIIAGAPTGDEVRVYKTDGTITKTFNMLTGPDGVKASVGGF